MAKKRTPRLSLGELQRLAEKRRADLEGRRATIEKELQSIESELQEAASPAPAKSGRGRATRVKRKRVVRQVGGQPPLREVLIDVLRTNPSGLDLKELATGARNAGYISKSKDFGRTVYQCVYGSNEITRDKRSKKYRLKGRVS